MIATFSKADAAEVVRAASPDAHPAVRRSGGRRAAFTLVELLVVIAMLGLLVSILLPAIATARSKQKSVQCQGQMRQLFQAAFTFITDNKGEIPFGVSQGEPPSNTAAMRAGVWGMDKTGVANLQVGALWKYVGGDADMRGQLIWCPADGSEVRTDRNFSYSFNDKLRVQPISTYRGLNMRDVKSPPRTIYIVEEEGPNDSRCVSPWTNGQDRITGRHGKIGSFKFGTAEYITAGRSNVVFLDGHVETIFSQSVDNSAALFTP